MTRDDIEKLIEVANSDDPFNPLERPSPYVIDRLCRLALATLEVEEAMSNALKHFGVELIVEEIEEALARLREAKGDG